MKQAKKGLLIIILVVLAGALLFLIGSRFLQLNPPQEATLAAPVEEDIPLPTPPATTPEQDREEEPDETRPAPTGETVGMRLALGGDMILHTGLNSEAKTDDGYDYAEVFQGAAQYISAADYAVATMETTFTETEEYSGYPRYKSPDGLASSLKSIGFDLINTANDHCMDGEKDGLIRTLDVLETNGLAHVGTYRREEERSANSGITVAEVNGLRIAFLAYSCDTNDIPVTEFPYVVNLYRTESGKIDQTRIDEDMAAARALDADMIAVFMHWGLELQTVPNTEQNALADHLFAQGADLIIGGHPHTPQPIELRQITDMNGREKTVCICYSLGNLVSCQADLNTNLTAIVNIDIEKDLGSGETYIKNVSYVPMYMMNLYDYDVTDAGWRYRLLDLHATIEAYENGTAEYLTEPMYRSLCEGLETIHSVFGEEFDAANAENVQ